MSLAQPDTTTDLQPLLNGNLEREIARGIELAIAGRYEDLTEHALRVEQQLARAALSAKLDPDAGWSARGALDGLTAQTQALEDVMTYASSVHRILQDVAKSATAGYGPSGMADKPLAPQGAHVRGEA